MIWNKDSCAVFSKIREDYGYLSNMTIKYPIKYQGVLFNSSEHLYQSLKFNNQSIVEHINSVINPLESKRVAYTYPNAVVSDWDKVKVLRMYHVLLLKVQQYPELYADLCNISMHMHIVEYSKRDSFWGAKPIDDDSQLIGENKLGLCWMKVRQLGINNTNIYSIVIPSYFKWLPDDVPFL